MTNYLQCFKFLFEVEVVAILFNLASNLQIYSHYQWLKNLYQFKAKNPSHVFAHPKEA